ncbi:MAG: glycosyltransferase family 39 protein [Desulfohalobiaceae bacterium]|nr:glycosyltransferase family 39 protein [Desulfohalobiaceae bacterium]
MSLHKTHLMAIAILGVFFTGLFNHHLWSPDEPRVAAIALEMSRTGDIVVPSLGGTPFVEKPPLYFAVGALFIYVFGGLFGATNALRLVTALFGIMTVVMCYFLTKRLYGRSSASLAAILLSTMLGFVVNFHWVRIDAALSFFVIAAIWSFSTAYMGDKAWACLWAGFFAAGAFLTKGFIGVVLIGIPWLCLFVMWFTEKRQTDFNKSGVYCIWHLLGLLCFIGLSGTWIVLLKEMGGQDLWHEWFWVNHIGRFTGNTSGLGHLRPGEPMYYIKQLALDSLPWFPLILLWVWGFFRNVFTKNWPSKADLFVFIWGAGSLVLLSIATTKRGIYLVPLYPVFAIAASQAFAAALKKRYLKVFYSLWCIIALTVGAVIAILPFLSQYFNNLVKESTVKYISTFGFGNCLAGVGFLICGYILLVWFKKGMDASRLVLLTCILYVCLLSFPVKVLDHEKNFQPGLTGFVNQVPLDQRSSLVAYDFSETATACFYYYADWILNHTRDTRRIQGIIAGKNKRFKGILLSSHKPLSRAKESFDQLFADIPYTIMASGYMGATGCERGFFWITGDSHEKSPS